MRLAVKSHALPVYKKNRIASLLCIFESILHQFTKVGKAFANKIVPDQPAPIGEVWSGIILLLSLANYP